jgi:hypothetical protein
LGVVDLGEQHLRIVVSHGSGGARASHHVFDARIPRFGLPVKSHGVVSGVVGFLNEKNANQREKRRLIGRNSGRFCRFVLLALFALTHTRAI